MSLALCRWAELSSKQLTGWEGDLAAFYQNPPTPFNQMPGVERKVHRHNCHVPARKPENLT
jgi:hypothetical protein